MGSVKISFRLNQLDRLVNDPNVLLDAARVSDLLGELASDDDLVALLAQPQRRERVAARAN